MKISLHKITPDPGQPRKLFDAAALAELAESIRANGLLQPITVRPAKPKGMYVIVAGERRYRAHCLLRDRGLKRFASIDAIVRTFRGGADIRVKQIVENMARADMTALEEAAAFAELRDTYGLDEAAIATKLGLAQFRVRWRLTLLNLSPASRKLLESGNIEQQAANEVARLDRDADQARIIRMINRGDLIGWKAVRNAVDAILQGTTHEDLFGAAAPLPKAKELAVVKSMEKKVDDIAAMVSIGWQNGECIVASKIAPDRAGVMADKLAGIKSAISHMERELRNTSARAQIVAMG